MHRLSNSLMHDAHRGKGAARPSPTAPKHAQVVLLDGATGDTVWSKSGDGAYPVAHAGQHLAAATVVLTTDIARADGKVRTTLTLQAIDDAGAKLYARTLTLSVSAAKDDTGDFGFGFALPVGDLDADTAVDGQASLFAASGDTIRTATPLFLGRTGTARPGTAAQPLYGSVSGSGDDVATWRPGTSGLVLAARRGRDDRVLFSRALPNSRVSAPASPTRRPCDLGAATISSSKGPARPASCSACWPPTGCLREPIEIAPTDVIGPAPQCSAGPASFTALVRGRFVRRAASAICRASSP